MSGCAAQHSRAYERGESPNQEAVRAVAEITLVLVHAMPARTQPASEITADRVGQHRDAEQIDAAATVKVVAETPWSLHGEITLKPTPMPNATKIKVTAIEPVAPAKIAFQLTAVSASSMIGFPVSVIIALSPFKRNHSLGSGSTVARNIGSDIADFVAEPCAGRNDGTKPRSRSFCFHHSMEAAMGFGRGALLWLLGIPLPIILILALFMHH
ncbi:MAG: hypothetical protein WDN48_08000 [Pseudolabrys sp.]